MKTIKILSVSFPACNVFRKRSRTMSSGMELRLVMRWMRETAESMVRLRRVGGALAGSDICMTTFASCDRLLITPVSDPSRVAVVLNRFRSRRSPALGYMQRISADYCRSSIEGAVYTPMVSTSFQNLNRY